MDKSYYDHYWSDAGFKPEHDLWPELQAVYERHIPPGSEVLDLGCGDGKTSGVWLRENGHNYTGVDVSSSAVETASKRGLNAGLIVDATETALPDASFDVVTCIEVLEHLFQPQAAIREVRRVLRPGGLLIVTTPNIGYWRSRLNLLLMGRFDPIGDNKSVAEPWRDPHIRFFTPRTLGRMVLSEQLDIVYLGGHNGGLLNGMPWVQRYRKNTRQSAVYRALEARWPNLLAYRTCLVARLPT